MLDRPTHDEPDKEPGSEVVELLFQETASGDVFVTMPAGEVLMLEPDTEDVYRRKTVLARKLAATVAREVLSQLKRLPPRPEPPAINGEYLYTPAELAKVLSLDPSTVRRLFLDEPGVIRLGKHNRRDSKREYITLRIPASVAQRVLRERSNRRR